MNEMWSLLRQIAKELRYRQLDSLVGRPVMITSRANLIGDIEADIRQIMPNSSFELAHADRQSDPLWYREGRSRVLQKYGFVDLHFLVHSVSPSELPKCGMQRLRKLGFAVTLPAEDRESDLEIPDDISDEDFGKACLQPIAEDIAQQNVYLLAFLRMPRVRGDVGFPPLTWPSVSGDNGLVLSVVDACMTNSTSVWFNKYFYW
jgi:hypothetical protein